MDCSPSAPLSMEFSKSEYWCVLSRLSHVWLFATSWTVAHKAPLSMGFSRQEYWSGLPFLSLLLGSGLPFPTPGIFLTQELNWSLLCLLQWQADYLSLHRLGSPSAIVGYHMRSQWREIYLEVECYVRLRSHTPFSNQCLWRNCNQAGPCGYLCQVYN